MSYVIEPMPLITFIEDSKMKLPRFQRKASWDKKQNFELCISVFQDYPVGVVIINREQHNSWLLDGRQRRSALQGMRSNPVALYEWAKAYIGFKSTADEGEITKAYWDKVEKYLQKEDKPKEEQDEEADYEGEENEVEDSFDSERQKQGLTILLKLILMIHKQTPSGSRWEKTFDFTKYITVLKYAQKKDNYKVNPVALRKFLLEYADSTEDISEESFFSYYEENCGIKDKQEKKFKNFISQNWDYISNSISLLVGSEKVFKDARIGIITLTNVSPLDAQNIFSRINRGGTLLKSEELLSAKPYWNASVNISDTDTKALVKALYKKLGVEEPETIVRWDLAATLLSRLDRSALLFGTYNSMLAEGNEIAMDEVTLGFKLLSSIYVGGMSKISVNDLEKDSVNIDWENDINDLVDDINKIIEILMNDSFFQFLQSWKRPINKLLGSAITLEFITILREDWISKNRPTVSGSQYKSFQRDARVLLDRLIFEYSTKVWRGSGDSKMASDISNWQSRITPISTAEWKAFIEGASGGEYNGQPVTQKILTPVLYYYYALTEKSPINNVNVTFEVDHIIPQEKFRDNVVAEKNMKDSLTNLALLPRDANNSKKSKALNEITNAWLKQSIVTYSGITEDLFDKYSDISNIDSMKKLRGKLFLDAFNQTRTTMLAN